MTLYLELTGAKLQAPGIHICLFFNYIAITKKKVIKIKIKLFYAFYPHKSREYFDNKKFII